MAVLPHDIADLHLAPVVLALDASIEELGKLDLSELHRHVALVSDRPDWTQELREEALLVAVRHTIECHDWTLTWHPRGIRVSHDKHHLVLGLPANFTDFLSGKHREPTTA
jgi:hypothetical protein